MKVSEEAVEALATILAKEATERAGESFGHDADADSTEMFLARIRARKYLQAAAPHLMAQAWDEGADNGWRAARGEPEELNPYRAAEVGK